MNVSPLAIPWSVLLSLQGGISVLLAQPLGVVQLPRLMLGLVIVDEIVKVLLDTVHALLGVVISQGEISRVL